MRSARIGRKLDSRSELGRPAERLHALLERPFAAEQPLGFLRQGGLRPPPSALLAAHFSRPAPELIARRQHARPLRATAGLPQSQGPLMPTVRLPLVPDAPPVGPDLPNRRRTRRSRPVQDDAEVVAHLDARDSVGRVRSSRLRPRPRLRLRVDRRLPARVWYPAHVRLLVSL